jgi:dihydrofolate reductase
MRTIVARISDVSPAGLVASEGTEFFGFCRDLPDDQGNLDRTLSLYAQTDLHLIGRKSYEGMAEYFQTTQDDHPYKDAVNAARKVVVSRTLREAGWQNAEILSGDLAEEVGLLKQAGDGFIVVPGGLTLWQSLARLDLIDEYWLTVVPFLAAEGGQPFAGLGKSLPLELVSALPVSNGTVELRYRRAR